MDTMTTGHLRTRKKPCASTLTSDSRYTERWSKCPRRRRKNVSATRDCSMWFCSRLLEVGIQTSKTEGSLSRDSLPSNSQFEGAFRTETSLAVWSSYRDDVLAWLVRNGLQNFDLANAYVMLERTLTGIRATVWVRKKTSAVMVRISDRTLIESEIQRLRRESPTHYDELKRHGLVRVDIPKLR